MKRTRVAATMTVAALLLSLTTSFVVPTATAQTRPRDATFVLPYEAYITDAASNPVPDGKYDFTFELYDAPNGGKVLWTESHSQVQVTGGRATMDLGGGDSPLALPFDAQYFLSIRIGEEAPLEPRVKLPTSAYTFRATIADDVPPESITSEKIAPGAVTDDKIASISWSKVQGIPSEVFGVPANVWSMFGNAGTDPTKDYLGTADDQPLIIKTNGTQRMQIRNTGEVDIVGDVNLGSNLDVTNDLTVGNDGTFGNDVGVGRNATIGNDATIRNDLQVDVDTNVDGSTTLGGSLDVSGITNLNNATDVGNNNSTGALVVDGGVGIAKGLGVTGPTNLNSLETEGQATFNGPADFNNLNVNQNLTVLGNSSLNTLGTSGAATLGTTLQVNGATTLKSTTTVEGAATLKSTTTVDGKTHLKDDVRIGTAGVAAAELHVVGTGKFSPGSDDHVALFQNTASSGDGIAVKVGAGTPSNANNFATFYNSGNGVVGRIEGQNLGEYMSHPITIGGLVQDAAHAVALGIAVGTAIFEAADIVGEAADLAYGQLVFQYNLFNLGVSYSSGNGDYAEYLPRRSPSEAIEPGDIVGVFGGRVTRQIEGAEQIMVVSTAPIVLGNTPPDEHKPMYEKVAFMGQVPVRVLGTVESGDYIVPSGRNDGTGVAVHPGLMTARHYASAVGRAWTASDDPSPKTVIAVVGVGGRDVASLIDRHEKDLATVRGAVQEHDSQIQMLQAQVQRLTDLLEAGQTARVASSASTHVEGESR